MTATEVKTHRVLPRCCPVQPNVKAEKIAQKFYMKFN
jgi:hypothetical protein